MPSAVSELEVKNLALSYLGEKPITSTSDNRRAAQIINLHYPNARDTVLGAHPWRAAIKRVTLVLDTVAPVFGFTRQWILPNDYLRAMIINEDQREIEFYRVEGDRLLHSGDSVRLKYIARVENPTLWAPGLVTAIASYLAADAAMAVTNSQTMEDRLWSRHRERIQDARSSNAMEEPTEELRADRWLDARIGSGDLFRPIADA